MVYIPIVDNMGSMTKLQERLPGIGGFECLGLIREYESNAAIPVITFFYNHAV